MIARIEGVLIEREPPEVVIDCNGVGYEITCSTYTHAKLPADGERVALRVFTHATENKLSLFGFIDAQERTMFDHLIKVKNVGPTTAIAILSGSSPRELVALIAREDVAALTKIKGVGKKTAEMLVVELKDKCAELQLAWDASGALRPVGSISPSAAPARKQIRHPMVDEVMGALVGMGWRPQEAEAAIGDLAVPANATIEQLLRDALRSMPR